MSTLQSSPQRAKRKILSYLQSRGGVLRTGHLEVQQFLFWKCFGNGKGTSHHSDVTFLGDITLELETEGSVVLRRNSKGDCNYIALKSYVETTLIQEDNLSELEIEDVFSTILSEYYQIERALEMSRKDTEEGLRLAEQYEAANAKLHSELEASRLETEQLNIRLQELENSASYAGVRKILNEQEEELSSMRKEKRMAELTAQEKTTAIEQLTRELERLKSTNSTLKDSEKLLQDQVSSLKKDVKSAKNASKEQVEALQREITQLEKGDGLTPAKAAAVSANAIRKIMEHLWEEASTLIIEDCSKYLPEEKHDGFKKEASLTYKKIRRRAGD